MSNEIMVQEVNTMTIIEGLKLDRIQQSMNMIQQLQKAVQGTLVPGHDYGESFPGSKPSLLKPGAEKILTLFGLSSEYEIIEKIQDYEGGFFAYTVRCILAKEGRFITQGLGHCNSKEKKYTSDKQDIFMLGNTCLKMAKKRAQVDAALTVGSLSDIFTQDLEDMVQFNQNEKIDNMTLKDAENTRLTFGKHKGKTLREVLSLAPDYITWLLGNDRTDPIIRKACYMLVNDTRKEEENPTIGGNIKEVEQMDLMGTPFEDDQEIPF